VSSSAVFAQTTQGTVTDPTSFDFGTFTATFAGFAAGAVVLTELVKKLLGAIFKTIPSWVALVISWVLPVAASLLFHSLNVGIFEDLTLANTIIIGFGAALCSNGIFDCVSITGLLNLIYGKKADN
jgi:hypothetical protein